MKITIKKEPVAKAKLNLKQFRFDMKQTLNLKAAFFQNVFLTECNYENKHEVLDLIFSNTDWGNLLMLFEVDKREQMDLHVFECEIKGWITYKPISVNKQSGVVKFEPLKQTKTDFLVTNTFNRRFDKHIEYMLGESIIDYVNYDWKWEVDR